MTSPSRPDAEAAQPDLLAQVQALRRVALAVAHPGGPELFDHLARELAASLRAAMVFVAVFAEGSAGVMRTLAARLDGRALRNFEYPLEGSPCAAVVGHSWQYVGSGLQPQLRADSLSARKGMDSFAAFPLTSSMGEPLGLVVAMDRHPIAAGDAEHAEAMLKIVAGRAAAEIERGRTDEALRAVALAVSDPRSGAVFDELVRLLASILQVELAFIARYEQSQPDVLHVLAAYEEGRTLPGASYPLAGTPCETVLGQRFQAYATGVQSLFPAHEEARERCIDSYAGHPLVALDGSPLGVIAVASRRPLTQTSRLEATLKLFAMRAGAEVERLRANEALQRSEASYRAIFEASEDAIFVHDWDSGAVRDVNSKACDLYGATRAELRQAEADPGDPAVFPFATQEARERMKLARLGRCPPFEWQRRGRDGSLHWDEVRLTPAMLDGRPHVLAFSRDITAQKRAVEHLRVREEQYRAVFQSSQDGLFMWDDRLRIVDVNPAGCALYGSRRDEIVGRTSPRGLSEGYVAEQQQLVRRALAGETIHLETTVLRPDGSPFEADLRIMPFAQGGQPHALSVVRDVSERRRRERELQRSEARLRATVEAAFDAVVSIDGQGTIVEFNAAAERVFGHLRAAVLGRTFPDVLLPRRRHDAYEREMNKLRAGATGGVAGRLVETSMLRADGSEVPVELAMSVALVPEGSIVVGHLRDITERRRAEQALRDSEEQYRAIFNASVDALVLRDAAFRIVDVNATYEAMSGNARAEVLGIDRVLANPPEVSAAIRALHERALAGETVRLETEMRRRDGHRYDLELRGVPILHRGKPHVLYIGRDITQAKTAERALRDSEEQYRAIFNASADALVLRDADYRAVEVNPAYTAMSGYTREEVMAADRVLTQVDAAVRAHHRAEHELALRGKELRFEVTATRRDGSTLPAEVRGTPVSYRGQPHVLYAVRDTTERNAAEQRRRELERQLRQAQKMEAIGQLTGGIAHDFNNILTSVIGYVTMAQERPAAGQDPALARQLGQARLAAGRARDHVAQLLAFSRPQRGERRLLSPGPVAQQALELLRPNLPSSIAVEGPAGGDGQSGVPPVIADPVQLEQVLFNLCINARDAISDHGSIRVRVGHSAGAGHCASCSGRLDATSWVWFEVADNGRGMPHEVMERMFEPFFTTKEVGRGTGMGLAMVHGIVHDHGGHIQAESAPGQGSTFRVLLPVAAQDMPALAVTAEPVAALTRASSPPLQGRVLLVEDEPVVSDYMCDLLRGWGLEVVLERDSLAAAGRLASDAEQFDLLLTDQTMPGMTGLALSKHARRHRPGLPALLYTGNASDIAEDDLAQCGISALLRKPVEGSALRPLLRDLLAAAASPGAGAGPASK